MATIWARRARRFTHTNPRPELDCRIALTGLTEDLRLRYRRAAVVTAPLAASAGTNIKVLEAMAGGKALVSTTTGCAGLGLRHGEDDLRRVARLPAAAALLLRDPALRARLGSAARRVAEDRFPLEIDCRSRFCIVPGASRPRRRARSRAGRGAQVSYPWQVCRPASSAKWA